MGYGYIIGICIVLFVLLTGGFGVLLWLMLNRKEVKRSLLTHPRDRNLRTPNARDEQSESRDPDRSDDLQTDAEQ